MNKYGKKIIGMVLLVSLSLVLTYCSSKTSDSTSTTTGTTASAGAGGSAATSAIQSATLALSATAGGTNAPSFNKSKSLSQAVNGFYSGLRAKRATTDALKAKMLASSALATGMTITCSDGGFMTIGDITSDGTTTTTTTTYDNCKEIGSSTTTVTNGTLVFEYSESLASFTFREGNSTTPYTLKITQTTTGVVLEELTATMVFIGAFDITSATTCTTDGTPIPTFTTMIITMDGTMHSNGIDLSGSAYDETFVATALRLVSSNTLDTDSLTDTCAITGGTIQESGAISYTDNLDSSRNVTTTISASTPLTLTWTSVTGGDSYEIMGTISVSSQCFTGTLILSTTTAIFFPTHAVCPTAGVVMVSGDVTGTVTYSSTGGVTVKDGTGAIVGTYATCDDADVCI